MNCENERAKVRTRIEMELSLAAGALRRAFRYRQHVARLEKFVQHNEWHAERHKLRALMLEHALHSSGYARLADVVQALQRMDDDIAGRLDEAFEDDDTMEGDNG